MTDTAPPALPQLPDPSPVPEVPFAVTDTRVRYWPVRTDSARGREISYKDVNGHQHGDPSRSFLANRDNGTRHHVAVDLWGNAGDHVIAVEDGEIVHFYPFYNGVYALIVQCNSNLVINYGEVDSSSLTNLNLQKGARVKAGQPIAIIGKSNSGTSMCHFETYVSGTVSNQRWLVGSPPPHALLNPTAYLVELAKSGQ